MALFDARAHADLVTALHDLALRDGPETASLYAAAATAGAHRLHEAAAVARSARLQARLDDALGAARARMRDVLRGHRCEALATAVANAADALVAPADAGARDANAACAACGAGGVVVCVLVEDADCARTAHALCVRCGPVLAATAQLCHTSLFVRAFLGQADYETRQARAGECARGLRDSARLAEAGLT